MWKIGWGFAVGVVMIGAHPASGQLTRTFSSNFQGGPYTEGADITNNLVDDDNGLLLSWRGIAGGVTVQKRPSGRGTEVYLDGTNNTTGLVRSPGYFESAGYQRFANRYVFGTRVRIDEVETRNPGAVNASRPNDGGFSFTFTADGRDAGVTLWAVQDPGGQNSLYLYNGRNNVTRRVGGFALGETLNLALQIRSDAVLQDRLNLRLNGASIWRGNVDFGSGFAMPEADIVMSERSNASASDPVNRMAIFRYNASYNPEPGLAGLLLAGSLITLRRRTTDR